MFLPIVYFIIKLTFDRNQSVQKYVNSYGLSYLIIIVKWTFDKIYFINI